MPDGGGLLLTRKLSGHYDHQTFTAETLLWAAAVVRTGVTSAIELIRMPVHQRAYRRFRTLDFNVKVLIPSMAGTPATEHLSCKWR
jgi:hypothetical protein